MRKQSAPPLTAVFDRSVKLMFEELPAAACRLAGMDADPDDISFEDTAVNTPELRTDHLFRIQRPGIAPCALQLEYQLQPDRRRLPGWIMKNSALNHQLDIPVVLVVIHLREGRRKQFPSSHVVQAGRLQNTYHFETVKLWEQRERIRTGDLQELAPLLVLCEDNPSEETLREERRIIHDLPVLPEVKDDLITLSMMLGGRCFPADVVRAIFREDSGMRGGLKLIEELFPEALARGRAEIEAQMKAQIEADGRAAQAREIALRLLRIKFHRLPRELVAQIRDAEPPWCEELLERLLDNPELSDLLAWARSHRSTL